MKSDKTRSVLIGVAVILVGIIILTIINNNNPQSTTTEQSQQDIMSPIHPKNATYTIESQEITLTDGVNTQNIPNSSTVIKTQVWGEPVNKDISGNTQNFWAVVLNQEPGGSGSFYYIAACVGGGESCDGTNAIQLGDRISIQNVSLETDGTIEVNYADRPEGAAMTEQPSVGVTRKFTVIDDTLKEVMGS